MTYALNLSVKKIEVPLLLTTGVLVWNEFLFATLLMALLLLANDVVSMSITTDRVTPSQRPDRWNVGALMAGAMAVALPLLTVSVAVAWFARDVWPRLDLSELRTLVFLTLVASSQATVYLVRERGHFWHSVPGGVLVVASIADILGAVLLAFGGVLMTWLPPGLVAATLAVVLVAALLVDAGKVRLFREVGLHQSRTQ